MSLPFENIDDTEEIANEDAAAEGTPPPNNRIFIIIAAALGGIIVLALLCVAIYALVWQPRQKSNQIAQQNTATAQAMLLAQSVSETEAADLAEKAAKTAKVTPSQAPTATPTRAPATTAPTSTPVVGRAVTSTESAAVTPNLTATVSELMTQAALSQKTASPTSSGLPNTGFADDIGLPGLLGLAVVLVVVIFLARRLRS